MAESVGLCIVQVSSSDIDERKKERKGSQKERKIEKEKRHSEKKKKERKKRKV